MKVIICICFQFIGMFDDTIVDCFPHKSLTFTIGNAFSSLRTYQGFSQTIRAICSNPPPKKIEGPKYWGSFAFYDVKFIGLFIHLC